MTLTFVEELGVSLSIREMEIYTGKAGFPEAKRRKYVELFKTKNAQKRSLVTTPELTPPVIPQIDCRYRLEKTGEQVGCAKCHNLPMMDIYECSVHGKCVIENRPRAKGIEWCRFCKDRAVPVISDNDGDPASVALSKMISPGDKRPGIWRGGVLQIWTTRACDRSCYGCTQGSNLAGQPDFITPDQFRVAVESLDNYFGVVGMFGGNPAIHPQFDELCQILRGSIPWEQRGLWCNHPKGKGRTAAITFNPAVSNLNVHESQEAWDEFHRDWPECHPFLKGLDSDSRHSPPFVAMKDVISDEAERWNLIQKCDVNRHWSAMICVFRGQLRAYFCEIAAAQAMLHQDEPDYPDLGVPVVPGWWKRPMKDFEAQVRKHCHECGIPLRGHGALANSGPYEQVSETHKTIYRPKRTGRTVEIVTELLQLGTPLKKATDYIENGAQT